MDSKGSIVGGPDDNRGIFTSNGWITNEAFLIVLEHFQKFTNASVNNRALLLMDNHSSHCSFECVKYARENGISLLTFPPHLTNKIQPLDIGLYGPLKKALEIANKDRIDSNPKSVISLEELPGLTKKAFSAVFTQEKIKSSFQASGLWPVNHLVFADVLLDNDNETASETPMAAATPVITEPPATSESLVTNDSTANNESLVINDPVANNESPTINEPAVVNEILSTNESLVVINETPARNETRGPSKTPTSKGSTSSVSSRSSIESLLHSIRPLQSKFSSSKSSRMGKSSNLTYSPEFDEIKKKMIRKKNFNHKKVVGKVKKMGKNK